MRRSTGLPPRGSINSMKSLKTLREGWEQMRRTEEGLHIPLTVASALQQLKALWQRFAPMLEQTEAIFRTERLAHLTTLQARLRCLTTGTHR